MPRFQRDRAGLTGWQQKAFDKLGPKDQRRFLTARGKLSGEGQRSLSPDNFRSNNSGFYSPSRSGGTE